MKLVKSRSPVESNLFSVVAMLLDSSIEEMMINAGFKSHEIIPLEVEAIWSAAKKIAVTNGLTWLTSQIEEKIRIPENRLMIPDGGTGVVFTWSWSANGGLFDDGTLRAVCVEAFSDGLVFDPCLEETIPVKIYQQILEEIGGKVIKIMWREKNS